MNNLLRYFLITAFIGLHVSCDQVSKHVVRENLTHQSVQVIPDHFRLIKVQNKGAFLGSLKHLPDPFHTLLLKILPLLVVFIAIFWLLKTNDMPAIKSVSLIAILGGGLGNLIDRIWLGSVTDFMQIKLFGWHTGIFNMADVSISVGFLVLVGHELSILVNGISKPSSQDEQHS